MSKLVSLPKFKTTLFLSNVSSEKTYDSNFLLDSWTLRKPHDPVSSFGKSLDAENKDVSFEDSFLKFTK
jgi:hypothetical protein